MDHTIQNNLEIIPIRLREEEESLGDVTATQNIVVDQEETYLSDTHEIGYVLIDNHRNKDNSLSRPTIQQILQEGMNSR